MLLYLYMSKFLFLEEFQLAIYTMKRFINDDIFFDLIFYLIYLIIIIRTIINLSLLSCNNFSVVLYASIIILRTSASIKLPNFLLYGFLVF